MLSASSISRWAKEETTAKQKISFFPLPGNFNDAQALPTLSLQKEAVDAPSEKQNGEIPSLVDSF